VILTKGEFSKSWAQVVKHRAHPNVGNPVPKIDLPGS
jgi:hypothetical protein